MLSLSLVKKIDRLLKVGKLSQRKIAARVGVSRGTVASIAQGKRGLYGRDPDLEGCVSLTHSSPPERCSKCGYLVFAPCLVCRAREFQQHRKQLQAATIRPEAAKPPRRRKRRPTDVSCGPRGVRVA
jgi:DNA-binding XRE family transcriptional regulator